MRTKLQISLTICGLILFIFISIHAQAQYNWPKYENNPVLEGTSGEWNQNIFYPSVLFHEDLFQMWYCGWEDESRQIGYAFSTDGLDWFMDLVPVIPGGESDDWDIHKYPGTVLFIDDTLRMWYYGSTNSADNFSIGYAWAVNTNEWNLFSDPVLEKGEAGTWDDLAVLKNSVYFDGIMYHMYYTGMKVEDLKMRIGHATSTNGINWEKDDAHNPVMTIGGDTTFYDNWISAHGLVFYNGTLHMFFEGFTGAGNPYDGYLRVGYAWSTDFVTWTIESELWPVLDVGVQGSWDELWAGNPTVLVHNDYLKMWYAGCSNGPNLKIGYAAGDKITGVPLNNHDNLITEQLSVFPSPFRDQLIFSWRLQAKSPVQLEVFNSNGQSISTLVNEVREAGKHEVFFNGTELPAGVYFCVLKTNQSTITEKIIKLN